MEEGEQLAPTKDRLIENIQSGHASRGELGLSKITFQKCHAPVPTIMHDISLLTVSTNCKTGPTLSEADLGVSAPMCFSQRFSGPLQGTQAERRRSQMC